MSYMQTTYFFLKERPGPGFRDKALIFTQPMAILPSLVINIWPIPTARALCTATTSIRRMGPHCRICHRGRSKSAFWVAHRFIGNHCKYWERRWMRGERGEIFHAEGENERRKLWLLISSEMRRKEPSIMIRLSPLTVQPGNYCPQKCLYAHPHRADWPLQR